MGWARRDGIGGVLVKKHRGVWLYFPALPTFDWMRAIQHKDGLAPAFTMQNLSQSFVESLGPTSRGPGTESLRDPRQMNRRDAVVDHRIL